MIKSNVTRNETKRLIKTLQQQYVTPSQIRMAAIILAYNGIDAALEYVHGLASGKAMVPFEAAEAAYLEEMEGYEDASK